MSSSRSETHEKLLRSTMAFLEEGDLSVGMAKIAARAGVSRQAVYLHFESRAALLLELVEWTDETLGLNERLASLATLEDPYERLVEALRIGAWYEPKIRQLALVLDGARYSDGAVREAWEDRMGLRRRGYQQLLESLSAANRLRVGVDPRRGAEMIWNLSSPASYRNLVVDCGWTDEEWSEWLVETVTAMLVS